MKRIGIIGAMSEEVLLFKDKMTIKEVKKMASFEFYLGVLLNKEIVVVECGIGKVNSAVCSQLMIDHFQVDCIINSGVAGGLANELNIGDIVVSNDAIQHDVDVRAFGLALGVIPRMDNSTFVADPKLVQIAMEAAKALSPKINAMIGRVVSGDQFISESKKKEELIENFQAACAEMEGASIAHVCYLNQLPFVIIRAISDKADDSAHVNYSEFVVEAANNSFHMIEEMLVRL